MQINLTVVPLTFLGHDISIKQLIMFEVVQVTLKQGQTSKAWVLLGSVAPSQVKTDAQQKKKKILQRLFFCCYNLWSAQKE